MLLMGESINFENHNENGLTMSQEEINAKYQRGEMRIITEQGRYPLQNIKEILSTNMKLNPEYQRRRVWDHVQKSRLIESFIINIPIPPVFLYEIEFSSYEVMDGLQRLSTLYEFYDNKFRLSGLEVWPELNGKTYKELPEKIKQGIDRRYISTIVILKETAKNLEEEQMMKKFVFERLNTGGTKLTDQETRNALYDGIMNDLCIKISNECQVFHKVWKIKPFKEEELIKVIDDEVKEDFVEENKVVKSFVRMEDVELVLRFYAYRQLESNPASKVKDILDSYLIEANKNYSQDTINELETLFYKTIDLAHKIFGDKAFLMMTKRRGNFSWYNRPSKLVYDPMMIILSQYVDDQVTCDKLISNSKDIIENIKKLFKSHAEDFNGRNNNKSDVIRRKKIFKGMFDKFIEEQN